MTIKAAVTVMLEIDVPDGWLDTSKYTVKQLFDEAQERAVKMVSHMVTSSGYAGRIKLTGTPRVETVITGE